MAYVPIGEHEDAITGETYRSTWHFSGPYPPGYLLVAIKEAVKTLGRVSGRFDPISYEFFDKGNRLGGPYNTWAFRLTWKKQGSGSPLFLFTGAGGVITGVIVVILVAVTGTVIAARTVEHLVESVPEVKEWAPALILGAILLVGMFLKGRA